MLRRTRLAAALAALSLTAATGGPGLQTAVFAGGCFWTMEHGLETIPGVVKAVSGYTGGELANPSYEDVSTETTGHVEAVQVTFDPAKISYAQLTDRYFHLIDPTDTGGQACDRGASYRANVFVASPEQARVATAVRQKLATQVLKTPIVVPIRPATRFWPAEGYHQQYTMKNPVQYAAYRIGCGRDRVLGRIWGTK